METKPVGYLVKFVTPQGVDSMLIRDVNDIPKHVRHEVFVAADALYTKDQLPTTPDHGVYQPKLPEPTPLRTILMPESIAEAHVLIAMGRAFLESVGYTGPSPTKVSITLPEAQVNYRDKYIDLCLCIETYFSQVGTDRSADCYDSIIAAIRSLKEV